MAPTPRERSLDRSSVVLDLLDRAYCEEWLACYGHWVAAKLAAGGEGQPVAEQLLRHAQDEMRLAEMLADRIIELGGTPDEEPRHWHLRSEQRSVVPKDRSLAALIDHGLEADRCVIDTCRQLLRECREDDPFTYDLTLVVLEKEVEHEESLEALARGLHLGLDQHG